MIILKQVSATSVLTDWPLREGECWKNPTIYVHCITLIIMFSVEQLFFLESLNLIQIISRNLLLIRDHVLLFAAPDHQSFLHLPYGENLRMKLFQHYSKLNVVYRSKADNQDLVIVNKGVLVTPLDPQLEGRLIVDGSELVMKKIHTRDTGVFKVTDLDGFTVAHVYIDVEGNKNLFIMHHFIFSLDINIWH